MSLVQGLEFEGILQGFYRDLQGSGKLKMQAMECENDLFHLFANNEPTSVIFEKDKKYNQSLAVWMNCTKSFYVFVIPHKQRGSKLLSLSQVSNIYFHSWSEFIICTLPTLAFFIKTLTQYTHYAVCTSKSPDTLQEKDTYFHPCRTAILGKEHISTLPPSNVTRPEKEKN